MWEPVFSFSRGRGRRSNSNVVRWRTHCLEPSQWSGQSRARTTGQRTRTIRQKTRTIGQRTRASVVRQPWTAVLLRPTVHETLCGIAGSHTYTIITRFSVFSNIIFIKYFTLPDVSLSRMVNSWSWPFGTTRCHCSRVRWNKSLLCNVSRIRNKTRPLNLLWPKLGSFWILPDYVECFASAPTLFQRIPGVIITQPGVGTQPFKAYTSTQDNTKW